VELKMKMLDLEQLTKAAHAADVSRKSYRARWVEELQKDTQLGFIVNSYARPLAEAEATYEMYEFARKIAAGGDQEDEVQAADRVKYANENLAREAFRRLSQQSGNYGFSEAMVGADRVAAKDVLEQLDALGLAY
jgi:hypothetical protein